MSRRAAERSYGIADDQLTSVVSWSGVQLAPGLERG